MYNWYQQYNWTRLSLLGCQEDSRVTQVLFFYLSPCDFQATSANRHETLLHDRYQTKFYNATPKIRGPSPKNFGPKTCKIWCDFTQLLTLVANISGKKQDIQNQKEFKTWSRTIPSGFGESSPVSFGPHYPESRTCEFGPTHMDLFGRLYFTLPSHSYTH